MLQYVNAIKQIIEMRYISVYMLMLSYDVVMGTSIYNVIGLLDYSDCLNIAPTAIDGSSSSNSANHFG